MKTVQLFDVENECCGPNPVAAMASFLRNRFPDGVVIESFYLKEDPDAPLPPALRSRLESEGAVACLPAMIVEGNIIAAGRLPNFLDAVDALLAER